MKKTLIAIAALAATGAFAQSTVTISGVVDMALMNSSAQVGAVTAAAAVAAVAESGTPGTAGYVKGSAAKAGVGAADAGTLKSTTFDRNGSSTSALNIAGVEDLGGGMKASFFFESNWNPASGASSTFANGQTFLGLSGDFGSVKLGAPNSAILETALTGDSFGTAVGGSYTGRFSRTGGDAGTRVIRNANSARYDSPVMGGFSASYEMAFANKDLAEKNYTTSGVSILGLRYAAGPLTVAFATGSLKGAAASANSSLTAAQAAAAATAANAVSADVKASHTLLSANYVMGAATVYGGFTSYKQTAAGVTGDETSSLNLGVKYAVSGTTTVQISMANRTDKTPGVTADNGSLVALGADYALSKRTTAYARYEAIDTNKASDTTGKGTVMAVGIKHTF